MAESFLAQISALQGQFVSFAGANVWDLILFTVGITAYSLFIYHFYKYVAERDIFKWDWEKFSRENSLGKFEDGILYAVRYMILYPVLVFLWFSVFASFMFVLGKNIPIENILLVSFGFVTTIRITAYYRESLSYELAKLVPLGLLAVYIVEPTFFNFSETSARVFDLANFWIDIAKFLAFSVIAEWILRILWSVKQAIMPSEDLDEEIEEVKKKVERFGR